MNRVHRTALVIEAAPDDNSEFRQRVNRLLESVNGDNIKVDVYTQLADGTVLRGRPSEARPGLDVVDGDFHAAGYVQVLRSSPSNGNIPASKLASAAPSSVWS